MPMRGAPGSDATGINSDYLQQESFPQEAGREGEGVALPGATTGHVCIALLAEAPWPDAPPPSPRTVRAMQKPHPRKFAQQCVARGPRGALQDADRVTRSKRLFVPSSRGCNTRSVSSCSWTLNG